MKLVGRLSIALLAILILGFSVAYGEIQIEYWSPTTDWANDARIEAFNAAYKGVYRVNSTIVESKNQDEKLPLSVAAGVQPHVVLMTRSVIVTHALSKALQPLDSLVSRDGLDLDLFYPATVAESKWEDSIYAIPWNTDARLLYYNVDMFEATGLDPEEPPKSWTDVERYNRLLNRRDHNGDLTQSGLWPHDEAGDFHFIGWLWAAGGELLDESGRQVLWNSPQAIDALTFMTDHLRAHGGFSGWEAFSKRYGSSVWREHIGMGMGGSWKLSDLLTNPPSFEWAVAHPPRPEGLDNEPVSWSGGFAHVIPNGIEGEELEAAWTFIKFMSSHEMQTLVGLLYPGQIPVLRSAAVDRDVIDLHPALRVFAELMNYSRFRPVSPFGEELKIQYRDEVRRLYRQDLPPTQILEQTARQMQAILDEGWGRLDGNRQ